MKSSTLPYWLTLIVVLGASYGFYVVWRGDRPAGQSPIAGVGLLPGEQTAQGPPLTEFTLTAQTGEEFHSRSLQGKVWVASVFFSACPSVCVRLNQQLAALQQDDELRDVQFVSISCAPETDTPEVLRDYASRFGADPDRWRFCTGDLDYIERIGSDILKISVQGNTHSERAVVVDRSGKVRGRFVVTDTNLPNQRILMKRALLDSLAEPVPEKPTVPDAEPAKKLIESADTAEKADLP